MTEKKIEEINGIPYSFHISTEQNGQFITGYIQLENYHEKFREFENPSLTIKRILYYHLFQKTGKYLVIKTSDIESDLEFKALYEIVDVDKIQNNSFNQSINTENGEKLDFELKILNDFEECENLESTPFTRMTSLIDNNSQQIMNLFNNIVFHIKVSSDNYSRISFTNEIEDFIKEFINDKFGNAFILLETDRINCNQKEVQIKYVIMPNGF